MIDAGTLSSRALQRVALFKSLTDSLPRHARLRAHAKCCLLKTQKANQVQMLCLSTP